MMIAKLSKTLLLAALAAPLATVANANAIEDIKARDQLLCTANSGSYFGFAEIDDDSNWKGFDIDFCRALATAILGDPQKVNLVPVTWANRFPALQSGELDVVFKATTWTLSRDAELGFQFSNPYFFAGTQFLVPADYPAEDATGLDGATGCGVAGSSTELVLNDYFEGLGITPNTITYEKVDEALEAYKSGRCDYYAAWGPSLQIGMARDSEQAGQHKLLPDMMSLDPISGVIRQGEDKLMDVMNFTIGALIEAERLGITQSNVEAMAADPGIKPAVARLLGVSPGVGEKLGLRETWAREVIAAVGNYAEVYDRNLGEGSPYDLPRGLNRLWSDDGLLFSPLFN